MAIVDDWMKWCRSSDSTIFKISGVMVAWWYVEASGREVW